MSSSDESDEDFDLTPPNIVEEAKILSENLLPPKSRLKYEKAYEDFMKWKTEKKAKSFSENVLLSYFNEIGKHKKPPTLWCEYSKIKTTLRLKHNINIGDYASLTTFLKRKSDGYKSRKSKVFSANNIETFLKEAPDEVYLLEKVVLTFGICGACRSNELATLTMNNIETVGNKIVIHLRCTKTKKDRFFVIQDQYINVVQKYQKLRPAGITTDRFFINYNKKGHCTKQVVGRHRIAKVPKQIATYLNLPESESYMGHCLRRSSATLLADTGANQTTLKRHGGWLSDKVAEGYIEESVEHKSKITSKINEVLSKTSPSEPQPSTSAASFDNETTETTTSSALTSSQSVQQVNLPGKSVQLTLNNCTNCNFTFNMK